MAFTKVFLPYFHYMRAAVYKVLLSSLRLGSAQPGLKLQVPSLLGHRLTKKPWFEIYFFTWQSSETQGWLRQMAASCIKVFCSGMMHCLFKTLFLIYLILSSPHGTRHTHTSLKHRLICSYFAIFVKLQWEYTFGLFTLRHFLQLKVLFYRCDLSPKSVDFEVIKKIILVGVGGRGKRLIWTRALPVVKSKLLCCERAWESTTWQGTASSL